MYIASILSSSLYTQHSKPDNKNNLACYYDCIRVQ